MKTGVVIVNYNKKDLLERCLKSIQKCGDTDLCVIVVDNGSTDGSIELVEQKFHTYVVVPMGYNAGFCKANNVGIDRAFVQGCDAVVLLNNDTEVHHGFFGALTSAVDGDKKIGMVASRILLMSRPNALDSAGLVITPDGLAKNRFLEESRDHADAPCEVFCPAGAAALYTRELLGDIRQDGMYLDENYAYYFEELDLGWRARLRGWSCAYAPDAIVDHYKNATSGSNSAFIAFYSHRNIYYNIIKNYPFPFCTKALVLSIVRYPALLCGVFVRKGAAQRFGGNMRIGTLIGVTCKGWWHVVKNMCMLMKSRRYIQKRKNISHTECKRWFDELGITFFDSLYK